MKKDWFIPVFFSCSSQRLGLEATVRVQRERAEAGAVCDCVENTEANRVMPLNASEQDIIEQTLQEFDFFELIEVCFKYILIFLVGNR